MASTSGPAKDQEGPVHGPQESTSSAAAAAAADASIPAPPEGAGDVSPPSPPPPPPPSSVQSRAHERAREQPGDGGRGADRSSSAAAAVDRKGKKKIGEDSSSPAPPDDREQAPRKEGRKKSDSPMKFLRSSILAIHGYAKKKLSDRKGKQPNYPNQTSKEIISKSPPHVGHKKVPIDKAFIHYFGNIHNALQHGYVPLHLAHLDTRYSELRPVRRDGEGFYRSFMFSYLEQVADRVDTREEDRLLDAVRKLATRAEHLQWASEFSRRCEEMHHCFTIVARHRSQHLVDISYNYKFLKYSYLMVTNIQPFKFAVGQYYNEDKHNYLFLTLKTELLHTYSFMVCAPDPKSEMPSSLVVLTMEASQTCYASHVCSYPIIDDQHSAFETLIEKIKKLKCMSEQPTSAIRGELLLELFSSYDTTDDIFAFLRLAAAIWICTHKGLYGQRVTGLGEGVSLEDWCSTQVIPPRVHADHVTMSALSRALGVAVRVEDTLDGRKKDLMAAELQSITRASNPRFRGIEDMYCVARGTPRVTLVRMYSH
nr:LOW QUALITY PROTEIN: uncharacterized protein LOC9268497 [Oryza sativa Japonica Group]